MTMSDKNNVVTFLGVNKNASDGGVAVTEGLSSIDIRILDELQKNSALSTAELADKVGLSQSPCWRRLQRLRDEGYIRREVAILDRAKLGSSFYVFAVLKTSALDEAGRAKFMKEVNAQAEITECHTIFGERDILLKVCARSLGWYQDFVFNTLMKLPGVVDIQSIPTLMELKSTTEVPLGGVRIA